MRTFCQSEILSFELNSVSEWDFEVVSLGWGMNFSLGKKSLKGIGDGKGLSMAETARYPLITVLPLLSNLYP